MKLDSRIEKIKRFFKFSVVGVSGVIVNMGLLWIFVEIFKIEKRLSGALSIEFSIINNFLWNNFWTWKNRRGIPFIQRLIRYNMITILTSAIFNYALYIFLIHEGLNYLISQIVGIGFAILINFILFEKLVFVQEIWKE